MNGMKKRLAKLEAAAAQADQRLSRPTYDFSVLSKEELAEIEKLILALEKLRCAHGEQDFCPDRLGPEERARYDMLLKKIMK